jgi:hypothetical protein
MAIKKNVVSGKYISREKLLVSPEQLCRYIDEQMK